MEKKELMKIIIETIEESIDIDNADENSSFMDDLDMSSMEIYTFIADLETKVNVKIPETILIKASTIGELATEMSALF